MRASDSIKLAMMKKAASRLVNAIMRDEGGFSLDTLHSMTELGKAASLPDDESVVAVTKWHMKSTGEEPRFWGGGVAEEIGIKSE
jgi:hypothetical protein